MTWHDAAYVIDLSFWAHKAWHAVPPVSAGGRPVNLIHGFAAMLVKLLADRDPRFLVAAADVGGRGWRHDLFPAYKAGRAPHPPGFDEQVVEVVRLLELHRIPVIGFPGHEADDVAGTLVGRFRRAGVPVVVITADKDLRQLVTDAEPMTVLWDGKDRWVGERTVRKDWKVGPDRVGDFLALTGDDGDGVPGVPGVGPVRAAELLAETRDLEHMLSLRRWGSSAAARALRAHEEQLKLSRRLVALREVPIAVELGACALGGYDVAGLRDFYERAGLERLAARLGEAPPKAPVDEAMASAWVEQAR
jgi:DNA polymerase-1